MSEKINTHIRKWIKKMEKLYSDSIFEYGYNNIYNMHVISFSPVPLIDNDDFKNDICLIYDDIDDNYDSEIIVVPSNDVSIRVVKPLYKTVLNNN